MRKSEVILEVRKTCSCKDNDEAEGLLAEEMETLGELCHMGQLREQDLELACARLGLGKQFETYFIEGL